MQEIYVMYAELGYEHPKVFIEPDAINNPKAQSMAIWYFKNWLMNTFRIATFIHEYDDKYTWEAYGSEFYQYSDTEFKSENEAYEDLFINVLGKLKLLKKKN